MTTKRTYAPQRTFDIDYDGLVSLLLQKNFSCSHVDIDVCKQDVQKQRQDRAEGDALEERHREHQARFSDEQLERHGRYSQLLNAARGIFRDDKAMMALLEKFGRRSTRRSGKDETTAA